VDNQVKIRGFRVELGEIESALSQHPAMHEAVVLAREDDPDDPLTSPRTGKRLVAYVIANDGSAVHHELRSFLKQKLPDHMIPSAFVLLDAFPLTANGKIDRKALPAPGPSRPELKQGYQTPRTPMEEMLAEIWREVLKLERIGIHDNFFDLGGHSLLATQVISRVRARFQMNLPLRTLFEMPTIVELANVILMEQSATLNQAELAGILSEIEATAEKEGELEISE
jgi:acyl carrier protein